MRWPSRGVCWRWSSALAAGLGWARGPSLVEALLQSWTDDQKSGVTQVGPHRAVLYIRLDDMTAKDRGD
jgi:recombinational DNA repair ATPase RecF